MNNFLERITKTERERVEQTVANLIDHYEDLRRRVVFREPYLIAGVGGILRRDDPSKANDIDIVAVGLKNSTLPPREGFDDAYKEKFPTLGEPHIILNFLERIAGLEETNPPIYDFKSSIPFEAFNQTIKNSELEARSIVELEGGELSSFLKKNFGGVRLRYQNSRPIDAIFSFGLSPQEWMRKQESAQEAHTPKGKSIHFPYQILHEVK